MLHTWSKDSSMMILTMSAIILSCSTSCYKWRLCQMIMSLIDTIAISYLVVKSRFRANDSSISFFRHSSCNCSIAEMEQGPKEGKANSGVTVLLFLDLYWLLLIEQISSACFSMIEDVIWFWINQLNDSWRVRHRNNSSVSLHSMRINSSLKCLPVFHGVSSLVF